MLDDLDGISTGETVVKICTRKPLSPAEGLERAIFLERSSLGKEFVNEALERP